MSKSLKQEILDYVKSSKEVTLKDLYNKFDQTKNSTIRGSRVLKSTNTSGYRGVSKNGSKWRARIQVDGKEKSLGTFDNILDAAKAYDSYILENNLNNTINGVLNE